MLAKLDQDLSKVLRGLTTAVEEADRGIGVVESSWAGRKAAVMKTFEAKLRELQKERIDGAEFIRLRREIEALHPLSERLIELRKALETALANRRSLLAEWVDVKGAEFRQLDQAAKQVTKRLIGQVRVTVRNAGSRAPLHDLLRDRVGGNLKVALDTLDDQPDLSLPAFVAAGRAGKDTLVREFRLPPSAAERLAQAGEDVFMRLEELDLPPTTEIELNAGSEHEPVWQALDDLSTGQKATAILLLLLLESDSPLIVDQPEDDLDNRFITEGVVPRMREEKQRRQFLFATHNANIPVLGDAELILGLSASAGQGSIDSEHIGALDDRAVREMDEEVLEGGKEAFERRRQKYRF